MANGKMPQGGGGSAITHCHCLPHPRALQLHSAFGPRRRHNIARAGDHGNDLIIGQRRVVGLSFGSPLLVQRQHATGSAVESEESVSMRKGIDRAQSQKH
jgi:hypothetical protein